MQDKDKMSVASIALAEYDPPLKVETENRNGKWVDYGVDNNYPSYLLSLYKASPTHHAVVDKMVQLIVGNGIDSNIANGKEVLNQLGLNEELDKLVFDYYLQGGAYLEIVRSKGGGELVVNHLPFENCRLSIADEDNNEVDGIWYSNDWTQYRKAKYEPKFVPMYSPQGKDARSVIILQKTTAGSLYYPSPSYEGALNYIEAEIQIGIYHNNQLLNGLLPSFVVNFRNGIPDEENRRNTTQELERKVAGAKNAGKFLVTFNEPGTDNTPIFETFPISDADKQYQFLSEECTDKILRSHRVTNPILFGVRDGGGLGNNANEMSESKRQMEEDVIFPDRRAILKQLLPLLQKTGIVPDWGLTQEDVESDVERSYTGIQITSAIDIISQVNVGTLTKAQGVILVQSMLGFDEKTANELFETLEATLSSDKKKAPTLTEDWGLALADGLKEYGQTIEELEEDGWELVRVEDAGSHEDEAGITLDSLLERVDLKAISEYANPGERSKWGDSGLYKLRYRYSGNIASNSRGFCKEMVSLSRNGYIFRKEDIDAMSDAETNGKFAEKGKTSYDIFLYKGGAACHHHWERLIFFRKRNERGEFLPPSPEDAKTQEGMTNDKRVGNVPFVKPKGKEAVAPINMPNKGFINR